MRLQDDHTAPLRLRLMEERDAVTVHRCRNLPEVSRYQGWCPETVAEVVACAHQQRGATPGMSAQLCQLVIEERRGEAWVVVGDMAVVPLEPGRQAELGIVLHPDAQGRGLARRACRLLITHLFTQGLHRLTARVDPRNTPSLRLFDAIPMRREGHEVESYWDARAQAWTDEICFATLSREWPSARQDITTSAEFL